jgi:hypothetical protein
MTFSPATRQTLFLELARSPDGTTAQNAYEEGRKRGDTVSEEAYFNLGRRLAHRGALKADKSGGRTVFYAKIDENATWLDEEYISSIIDPEYPLLALAAYRESVRQIRDIPDKIWVEARKELLQVDARSLFLEAIKSYAINLKAELDDYARERSEAPNSPHIPNLRRSVERSIETLTGLCRQGLGTSVEAIAIPVSADVGAEAILTNVAPASYYNEDLLKDELSRRIESGPLIRQIAPLEADLNMLIAGVDGSSIGGLLSLDGTVGDFAFGYPPQVSVNTATGVLNRNIKTNAHQTPVFLRLPEKPEDMQKDSNRYTIMAKMFYPDLTDSEYLHSMWNAMDLLECRATTKVMSRWTMLPQNLEMSPTDIVIRDGTVVPHDRDDHHYGQQNTYGRIVRDLIEASWGIAKSCREDNQTVMGAVKNAQMRILSPVINYFLCQAAANEKETRLGAWPIDEMNQLPDQALISRILTAGREDSDPWLRTALVLRPFHSTSKLGNVYSRTEGQLPYDKLVKRSQVARDKDIREVTAEEAWWRTLRVPGDPYLQMLRGVWYAGFYLGAFKRLDRSESLSRFEFIVPHSTDEKGEFPEDVCNNHLTRTLTALYTVGFEVDNEHSMFGSSEKIDLLPTILVRAHETVKTWAQELRSRVVEFMDWHLAKRLEGQKKNMRLRPWTRQELETWVDRMHEERHKDGG